MWDDDWLAQSSEVIIDPALEIVDADHHIWDDGARPRYLLKDLRADVSSGHNVTKTVFVECGWSSRSEGPPHLRPVGETERVASLWDTSAGAVLARIVGYVDLLDTGTVEAAIEAH